MYFLRITAVYLGLLEEDDELKAEWQRRACKRGYHVWGLWMHDTTPVPLYVVLEAGRDDVELVAPDGRMFRKVGYEHQPIIGPSYRKCTHCPALERRKT